MTLAIAVTAQGRAAVAGDQPPPVLSPAQIALFETPHFTDLRGAHRLDYVFRREENGKQVVEDSIRLTVRDATERGLHDVSVEFLTGPRTLHYPQARGFRGNPLLVYALDRETRELSAATGGSMLWFRNRIRRAYESADVRPGTVQLAGRDTPSTSIAATPFRGETRAGRYEMLRLTVILSEAVPGRIHTIRTDLPDRDGSSAVMESIVFSSAIPLEEDGK